jgi:hypothetical protein
LPTHAPSSLNPLPPTWYTLQYLCVSYLLPTAPLPLSHSPPLCPQKMHQTQHTLAAVENKESKENKENKEKKAATVAQILKSLYRVILYSRYTGARTLGYTGALTLFIGAEGWRGACASRLVHEVPGHPSCVVQEVFARGECVWWWWWVGAGGRAKEHGCMRVRFPWPC